MPAAYFASGANAAHASPQIFYIHRLSFSFPTPPVFVYYLRSKKKYAKINKGSTKGANEIVATISKEDLRNYFQKAKDLGIEYVSTCEHFDYMTNVDGYTWIADYDELIKYHKILEKEFERKKKIKTVNT